MRHLFSDHFSNISLKKLLGFLLALCILASCQNSHPDARQNSHSAAQLSSQRRKPDSTGQRLTIVNWNIEWLGSTRKGPKDKDRQLANASKILQYLHADIYCLCEIVDPASLQTLTTGLGKNYQYVLSDYASGAKDKDDPAYLPSQKLAYIYNTEIFSKIKAGPLLKENARAGYYFANGRYPFELTTKVQINGISENISFFLIHAKSGADHSSYDRRQQGALLLKNKLEENFKNNASIILGDFNDMLEGSIAENKASPYAAFVSDAHYHGLTLEATIQKEASALDYPTVIDGQLISATLNKYYLAGTTKIRTDVQKVVPDFSRGSTSDHYPVSSVFLLNKSRQEQPPLLAEAPKTTPLSPSSHASTTPSISGRKQTSVFTAQLEEKSIGIRVDTKVQNIQFILYNARGNKVLSVHRKFINKNDLFSLRTPGLYPGKYTLVIFSDHGKQIISLLQP